MARKAVNRDEDIDPQAIARWNDDGGAPRPLTGGASRFGPHDAVELEIRPIWGDGTQAEQDPRQWIAQRWLTLQNDIASLRDDMTVTATVLSMNLIATELRAMCSQQDRLQKRIETLKNDEPRRRSRGHAANVSERRQLGRPQIAPKLEKPHPLRCIYKDSNGQKNIVRTKQPPAWLAWPERCARSNA